MQSYDLGANSYIRKPVDLLNLRKLYYNGACTGWF